MVTKCGICHASLQLLIKKMVDNKLVTVFLRGKNQSVQIQVITNHVDSIEFFFGCAGDGETFDLESDASVLIQKSLTPAPLL